MKPKVLFIMHMPPPVHGAAMMGQYIHDSKVINEAFDCRYINPSASHIVAEVGKVSTKKLRFMVGNMWKILRTVRSWKPNLCYYTPTADGYGIYRDILVVSLLKLFGQKVVLHMHNKGVKQYAADHRLARFAYRRIFKNVKVILLAEVLYDDVKQYVRREDVFICPNGIPETLDHEPQAERHNEVPHLLFLSNLLKSKGVLVLLDALKILKDKSYSFVCDFVGGETAEIDAERFSQEVETRELNQLAIYQGKKYRDEKEVFFNNADIFIFPTFYPNECFPLVLLEAMQHALPCITTREGAIPDIIADGKNGLLTQQNDPSSLAESIATLIDNSTLRQKLGKEGRRTYQQHLTLDLFEQRMRDILTRITIS